MSPLILPAVLESSWSTHQNKYHSWKTNNKLIFFYWVEEQSLSSNNVQSLAFPITVQRREGLIYPNFTHLEMKHLT